MPPYPDLQGLPPSHTRPPRSTAERRDAASSAIFARIYAAGNTTRSDTYERLQLAKELEGVRQQTLSLPPMPKGSYAEVIKGPARRLEVLPAA